MPNNSLLHALLLATCVTLPMLGNAAGDEFVIRVYIRHVPDPRLAMAQGQADRLLRQAGVRIVWSTRKPGAADDGFQACGISTIDVREIEVELVSNTPANLRPGALGFALPFAKTGPRVFVFLDRVTAFDSDSRVLGAVIAHEIGHMLIGTLDHASSGVMKANWDAMDIGRIEAGRLFFSEHDLEMIQFHERVIRRCEDRVLISATNARFSK